MDLPVPERLRSDTNRDVLNWADGRYAHSDIAEKLENAVTSLGDVQHFCPDTRNYKYLVVSTKDVVFGVATGMTTIAFRLDSTFKERALRTGADDAPEIGRNWVSFTLFRGDWPAVDLEFWARKAYVFARESSF